MGATHTLHACNLPSHLPHSRRFKEPPPDWRADTQLGDSVQCVLPIAPEANHKAVFVVHLNTGRLSSPASSSRPLAGGPKRLLHLAALCHLNAVHGSSGAVRVTTRSWLQRRSLMG